MVDYVASQAKHFAGWRLPGRRILCAERFWGDTHERHNEGAGHPWPIAERGEGTHDSYPSIDLLVTELKTSTAPRPGKLPPELGYLKSHLYRVRGVRAVPPVPT